MVFTVINVKPTMYISHTRGENVVSGCLAPRARRPREESAPSLGLWRDVAGSMRDKTDRKHHDCTSHSTAVDLAVPDPPPPPARSVCRVPPTDMFDTGRAHKVA
eukprot:3907288-Prymnesium_polylepis.1